MLFFFFKQKTAYEILIGLVGSEMCIRDSIRLPGYLQGTDEMQMKSAAFLRGLFYTARDLVFVQAQFLEMIDGLLGKLSP